MRLLLTFMGILVALPASAWVPALAPSGCFERWYAPDSAPINVTVAADSAGIGAIAPTDVHTALVAAMKTWTDVQCTLCANPGGAGCAPQVCASNPIGITLQDGGVGAHTPWGLPCGAFKPDGSCQSVKANGNYVVSVTQKSDWLWSQFAASQTVLTTNNATGEIIDADILFNLVPRDDGSAFAFCQGDCAAKPSAYPLCIPLTHELGHLLGLNHSAVVKSTMAVSAVPTDVYKCQLADDDKLGICTIYRETCSGIPGELSLTTAECDARALAGGGNTPAPAPSCQANVHQASSASLWLLLGALSLIRLGWGRSRARRT